MQKTKNIIFDLGGVILNIDFKQTALAFAELGVGNFNEYYMLQTVTPLFEELETGTVTPAIFYDEFRKLVKLPLSDQNIVNAWNALLLDFPPERIQFLKDISKQYNIYLLSNTNEIHYQSFINSFEEKFGFDFNDLFKKAYYSHQVGYRKPSKEIFEAILKNEKLIAAETLFIDDSEINIQAAELIGLQTIHLPSPKTILEIYL